MKFPVYMDNHATTPMDPRVLEKMLPYFTERFGNAASRNHKFGWEAEATVDHCREVIAQSIGADPSEIIFTSGATESDNLAVLGTGRMYSKKGNHIITVQTEHKAILDSCAAWEREGGKVTYLPVDSQGMIDLDDLRKAITSETLLISVMMVNNEIGVIQPIREIGAIARAHDVFFHTDATQGVGKLPVNVQDMNIDLMSFTAHKIYGPKGIGALYVRKRKPRVRLTPILFGGGHERGMRSGTLNVPGIVGLAEALRLSVTEMESEQARIGQLRDRLEQGLRAQLDEIYLNGHPQHRLPGNLNLSFAYVEGEGLMMGIN
ncbi:MAG: aminotransferase class V-fold PLP-dependent enzyme, partial [Acidobacteria bacterium]|nr:aminotransferase class V-fold PLP-dependent enzyme [Acidobacteriota bacterium]